MWISDDLGKFLDYDKSMLEIGIMTCAHVLISLDFRKLLVENTIMQYKVYSHHYKLDYEGLPFCCHEVGHIYRQFPLVQKGHGYRGVGGSTSQKSMDNKVVDGNMD